MRCVTTLLAGPFEFFIPKLVSSQVCRADEVAFVEGGARFLFA